MAYHTPAVLVLAEGTVFRGVSIGAEGISVGEAVFNTATTGYQEILTDPSYYQQIVTLTYPHVGNTGTNSEDSESKKIYASGLVIRDLPAQASNWRNEQSLSAYLQQRGILGIAEIDTRKLTRILREKGAQNACIMAGKIDEEEALRRARGFAGLVGADLVKIVSCTQPYVWDEGVWSLSDGYQKKANARFKVVAYDYGIKHNILRMLTERGCEVTVVPAQTPAKEVLAMQAQGVFLSNGPGDPEPCTYAISAIEEVVESATPVFGICLGHQLLALASGAKTKKMKFGHHGANHPVLEKHSGRVLITSQNHGFAVDMETLPGNLRITHTSLFDGTLQGIERTDKPAFSFQGHPEASPGPGDVGHLFDAFINRMQTLK